MSLFWAMSAKYRNSGNVIRSCGSKEISCCPVARAAATTQYKGLIPLNPEYRSSGMITGENGRSFSQKKAAARLPEQQLRHWRNNARQSQKPLDPITQPGR